jgi:hypothetical protein
MCAASRAASRAGAFLPAYRVELAWHRRCSLDVRLDLYSASSAQNTRRHIFDSPWEGSSS